MSGMELPTIFAMVSGGIQAFTGIMSAVRGSQAAEAQADFAQATAEREAQAQRIEDQFLRSRARVRQYSGVVTTSGSPLMDDLENARRIRQRFQDRLYQGRLDAFSSRAQIPGLMFGGFSQVAQGGLSIASALYRQRSPSPVSNTALLTD